MFQTTVVPLDGSDLAKQVLSVAARIARALGGTLYLVRVTVSPFSFSFPVPYILLLKKERARI